MTQERIVEGINYKGRRYAFKEPVTIHLEMNDEEPELGVWASVEKLDLHGWGEDTKHAVYALTEDLKWQVNKYMLGDLSNLSELMWEHKRILEEAVEVTELEPETVFDALSSD